MRDQVCDECGIERAVVLISSFDGALPKTYCDQHLIAYCLAELMTRLPPEALREVAGMLAQQAEPEPEPERRPRRRSKSDQAAQEPQQPAEPAPAGVEAPTAGADHGRDPGDQLG